MIDTAYNIETYKRNIRKMGHTELDWEASRVINHWESGDEEMEMYVFLVKEEYERRKI